MSLYPYCKTGVPHAKAYQLNYTRCKGFKLEQLSPFLVGAWRKYFPTTLWFSTSYYFIDWPHFSGESQPLYPMYKYHFYLEQFDFFHFFYETLFKVTSKLPNLPWSTLKFYCKRRTLPKHSSTVYVPRNFSRRRRFGQKSNLARRLTRNEHSSEALKANFALPHRVKWKDLTNQ